MNSSACPKVGLKQDPASYRNYPSVQNYCYHCKDPAPVIFEHQKKFCLTQNYVNCQVFQKTEGCEFPDELKGEPFSFHQNRRFDNKTGLVIAAALVLLSVVGYVIFSHSISGKPQKRLPFMPSPTQTETFLVVPTEFVAVVPSDDETPQEVPGVTANLPNNMLPTPTVVVDVTATLENYSLIIHQVQEGESLVLLAQEYDTTPEAIIDINYGLPTPIWAGWTLVIPDGIEDTHLLPCFEVFFLAQDMSVDEFSELRGCNKEELKRYNIITGEMITGGQWVLIPREKNS